MPVPTIKFLPSEIIETYRDGETVFAVGQRAHAEIDTSCVGKGTCGLCRVRIVEGEQHLSPYTDEEHKHLGNVYHITRVRLSCRAVAASGDIVVEVRKRKRKHR